MGRTLLKKRPAGVPSLKNDRGAREASNEDMFRCLVVVPKSHKDGTHEAIRPQGTHTPVVNNKLEFSVAQLPRDRQAAISARAVALDVRGKHRSIWLVWDARTLHQGHLFSDLNLRRCKKFAPTRVRPAVFAPSATKEWTNHLKEHGYVAVGPILEAADIDRAAELLTMDVESMTGVKRGLESITDAHLPNHANTGLRHRGLPHGEFAWFLRSHPAVLKLWQDLYSGSEVVGIPASVALSPPREDVAELTGSMRNYFHENWLHLDYSPPLPERLYQSTLYVFPTALDAVPWARIGIMTCMAPKLAVPEAARVRLLAGCILGAAAKAPAGLKFGHLQKIGEGYGTKGVSVLKPRLHPKLTDADVKRLTKGLYPSLSALQRCALGQRREIEKMGRLCQLGAAVLKKLAHPRAVRLIYGQAVAT